MANKPRILSVLPKIEDILLSSGRSVYDTSYLHSIFETNKDRWRLPLSMDLNGFIQGLEKHSDDIVAHTFAFPEVKEQIVVHKDSASIYEISSAIFPQGYLSHYSAISVWGLSEQIPKSIYITDEQSASPAKSVRTTLRQDAIDQAFSRPQRLSETYTEYQNHRLILLRGKNTKRLGVLADEEKNGVRLSVTDLERTLIDTTVRPSYSGGVFEVLKAYRNAKENYKVSVNKISAYLSKMNYIYPYHQAIGFYLEQAGNYPDSMIDLFRKKPKDYDFYLTYAMEQMEYSEDWRLYYPAGMV